jgi:hypothetical protein
VTEPSREGSLLVFFRARGGEGIRRMEEASRDFWKARRSCFTVERVRAVARYPGTEGGDGAVPARSDGRQRRDCRTVHSEDCP